jgi:AraC-like DNA-binding protein
MMMINVLREALGPRWRPSEVYLETGWSPMLEQSGPLAEARIVCNYSMTAVVFPRSLLSLPMRQIHDLDIDAIQTLWQASAPAEDFVRSLQQALKPLLTNGYPDVQLAAEIAGMSVRTLQRRLQREGLSYSRLIEQVRFQQAVDYLRDPTIKLSEIAAELGYSDPANFTRAFQRWTGTSPSQFRQLELQGRD